MTKLLGVIGWPIAHSRSPAMQRIAIAAAGLDLVYDAIAVSPQELADTLRGAAARGFVGLNVTIPHKAAVLPLCEPDAIACAVGAVNTLHFVDGHIYGTNTDVHGFTQLLAEIVGDARFKRVTILGQGGAARAVVHALADRADQIELIARRPATLTVGGRDFLPATWAPATFARVFPTTDLLVDATSRGIDAAAESLPLQLLPATANVIDLVVANDTALTRAAIARGLVAVTGNIMLVHQGAKAFERWTNTIVTANTIQKMRAAITD